MSWTKTKASKKSNTPVSPGYFEKAWEEARGRGGGGGDGGQGLFFFPSPGALPFLFLTFSIFLKFLCMCNPLNYNRPALRSRRTKKISCLVQKRLIATILPLSFRSFFFFLFFCVAFWFFPLCWVLASSFFFQLQELLLLLKRYFRYKGDKASTYNTFRFRALFFSIVKL